MGGERKHRVVVVGGGSAGISVAARIRRHVKKLDLALIEPSDVHYYQPLWTLVGAGVFPREATRRREADFIPGGVTWIRDRVVSFDPERNAVELGDGTRVGYEVLVVAPGIKLLWDAIPGLREALGKDGVCSNYSYETVESTWRFLKSFAGGTAIFTVPATPIKCGGAPQKIMYLADDHMRKIGVREKSRVVYASALDQIFQVPQYARTLEKVIARKGIETLYKHELAEVRGERKEAVFRKVGSGEQVVLNYDFLHVTPPMGPPDCVRESALANADGWLDVDKYTLMHVRYSNIFGLGDASGLPTSKTGAAIRKQAPVVARNVAARLKGRELPARYDGYTSCPLVTGYGKLVLAEFDYDKNPKETFPIDQNRERRSMYWLKAYGLPPLYWHGMLRGRV
jgi:sulfide:quinone oxidoreductase